MSIKVMARVWENETVTDHTELLILLAMADFSDDAGNCFPSINRLAKKSRLSDRQAHRVIKKLCDKRWLELVEKGGVRNGKNVSNRYKILLADLQEQKEGDVMTGGDTVTPPQRGVRGDAMTPRGDAMMTPRGVTSGCPSDGQSEPSKKNVDVVSCLGVVEEEEAARLAKEFGACPKQAQALRWHLQSKGLSYVQEKSEIALRRPPQHRNGAFWKALDENWPKPTEDERAVKKKTSLEPDGWREWVRLKYPDAEVPQSWKQLCNLHPSVQAEFVADRPKAQNPPDKEAVAA
jgi:hypothetical protein